MYFFDSFDNKIDEKGRLVLPAAWREEFVSGGYLSSLGDSVGIFTEDAFEKHLRRLEQSEHFSRDDLSLIAGLSSAFKPDGQYRVTVSPRIREHVGLGRDVTVAGQKSHLAIFNRADWLAKQTAIPAEEMASKMKQLSGAL